MWWNHNSQLCRDCRPYSMTPSITVQCFVKTVWYSTTPLEDSSNSDFFYVSNTAVKIPKSVSSPQLFPVLTSQLLFPKAAMASCGYPISLNHFPSSSACPCLLPQHPPLTDASGYLVVVAPGAVWLADCGRQLFGGEPVATVAEVGHPCADGVISSEHTSVHWCTGHTAWHSCRRQRGRLSTNVFMRNTRHILERFAERRLVNTGKAGRHIFT